MKTLLLLLLLIPFGSRADELLIPMDAAQTDHLKAYGVAFMVLKNDGEVDWLLNYRGGSFMTPATAALESECRIRNVRFERLTSATAQRIRQEVAQPDANTDAVKLLKAARIAVYSPIKISKAEFENTDAVLNVLTYAEIPFEVVYDEEIMKGDLAKYDWLHLHHEDFTGQLGRNLHRISPEDMAAQKAIASRLGYAKLSQLKLDVAKRIKVFCAGGGFLFAMCSGAETFDIALAAEGVDIVGSSYDGDGTDPQAQSKLDFNKTLAFQNFRLVLDDGDGYGGGISFSNINCAVGRGWDQPSTYFQLFDFSAKFDAIPAMLVQNHESVIREFFGQTTAFTKSTVKSNALVMGTSPSSDRYIYGELGRGQWTFYGGHDPEGTRGGGSFRQATDLNLHPHSPGYRLILNNVLFPSARKKKRKT
ncbi:asparagine synthetase B [Fibrella aquatilis]|uniref:Asparagine synthetase B n=1 Tax=Fibrella aquatilis TaxID=2817059 RepID=A0A939G3Y1_9BACT|nr:asparagine synthetase B [Fibrella aquatilis]MBO0929985.1 asparagine synthetase B [Fibrella aquatilis]